MGRKKSSKLPPFVAMSWKLLNSDVYKNLSYPAAKILPHFLGKPQRPFTDPEYFSIEFNLSYPEAEKLGFAKATFAKCVRELQEKGIIVRTERGGLRGNGKGYNRFRLSKQWEYSNQRTAGQQIYDYKTRQKETHTDGYI